MGLLIQNKILAQYMNGNVFVTMLEDGTKIREYEDEPVIYFPESIDIKITNYCDMNCKFCHESSTTQGKHGDLNKLKSVLISLPAGVELAIGGGNPLDHPELVDFLIWCKERGLICNLTVNQQHLKKYLFTLKLLLENNLIKGLGISINGIHFDEVKELHNISDNIVFHVIAGVHNIKILNILKREIPDCKVLILGYKLYGRGEEYFSLDVIANIIEWKEKIKDYLGKISLSFDNLALELLDIKSLIDKETWEKHYMGDDFTYSMYIDAVEQKYAPTSRSTERASVNEMSLLEYFLRNKN